MPKLKRILIYPDGVTEKQVRPVWKPNANTVAYYPLSQDANDKSGNGNNGTIGNGVTFTTQSGVNCCSFPNTHTGIITLPALGTFSSLTVSMWIYSPTSSSDAGQPFALSPSSDNANFGIYVNTTNFSVNRWNGSNSDPITVSKDITDGNWYNIIVTNGSGGLKIYVNGIQLGSSNNVRTVKSDGGGRSAIGGGWSSGSSFNGYLNEVIIENTIRDDIKILEYYNRIKGAYGL